MSKYAVNGKEPIAAWIPSLDSAGNGTTTLTDLVGSNNGTLTNMVAASDWVADTGAGGVRALDFDGINDVVVAGAVPTASAVTMSVWALFRSFATSQMLVNQTPTNTIYNLFYHNGSMTIRGGSVTQLATATLPAVNAWTHIVAVISGTSAALYYDGSQIATGTVSTIGATPTGLNLGSYTDFGGGYRLNGRLDDVRIFNQALTISDIAYLYAGGFGRGRTRRGIIPILRQHYAAQGAR
jgi:hypothetical protein